MAEFDVTSIFEARGKVYVTARRRGMVDFELGDDTILGTVPVEKWMDVVLAKGPDGRPDTNVFAFALRNCEDRHRLAEGDRVYLERSTVEGEVRCHRCGGHWRLRDDVPPTLRADVAKLARASRIDAIADLRRRGGLDLKDARAVVVHLSGPGPSCHRCGVRLPKAVMPRCVSCKSFNYNWE